jgi:hypothetical protein
VGRKISDGGDRGTPVCQREWLEAVRLKRVDLYILHGTLWGVGFQVPGVKEGQVTGAKGRNPSGEKYRCVLDMEGFWLDDKCRIIAELCYSSPLVENEAGPEIRGRFFTPDCLARSLRHLYIALVVS